MARCRIDAESCMLCIVMHHQIGYCRYHCQYSYHIQIKSGKTSYVTYTISKGNAEERPQTAYSMQHRPSVHGLFHLWAGYHYGMSPQGECGLHHLIILLLGGRFLSVLFMSSVMACLRCSRLDGSSPWGKLESYVCALGLFFIRV